jgi:hypothetical protein
VVYISPTVTISTGDAQPILGEKLTDGYSFMPLVFYLQRNYSFNCDRFSELQSRIVKDIAWLCCLIFLRFNFATAVKDSVWLLLITIPRYVVGSMQESYVVSRIHYLLEHSTARQTPCLPSCKGTASHVRYECTQFIIRYHLYCSTAARPAHRLTTPFSNLSNPSNFSKWCSYGFLEYTEILVLTKTTIQF